MNVSAIRILLTRLAVPAALALIISCSHDRKAQIDKLRQQQASIEERIRELEAADTGNSNVDTTKFRFVAVTRAVSGPFDHFIRVQGKIDGDENAAVVAEAPGTVIERYADVGQKVRKGQVLARLDDSQAKSQLESLETQYRFASELFEKQQRLWEQKIGSEVQYLQSRTNKESLERQIASVKDQIEKFRIKSPIDGTVEEVNIRPGTVVSPDPRMPAFRVVAFRDIKVTAEVSEAYASEVNVGDRLLITFPDIEKQIESKISFVSKYINPVNRTFIIESELPGKIENLKANMIAIVQINNYHKENAFQLPMNVIQNDLSGSYIYKIERSGQYNSIVKQKVTLGNSYNGMAEITGGLKTGDLVVSTGFQDIAEGEFVRFGLQAMNSENNR